MANTQPAKDRVIARYRELLDQVAEELGGWDTRGTKRQVARAVGISPSMLTKIRDNPAKRVDQDTITEAVVNLNLDPVYFYARQLPRGRHYRAYVAGVEAVDPPHWATFLERYALPKHLGAAEVARIRSLAHAASGDIHAYEDLIGLAEWVLNRTRP